jgi:hypothetical protein
MATPTTIDNSSSMITLPGIVDAPIGNTTPYEGYYYAFYGEGGFTMDQCFNTINLIQQNPLLRYDVTKALQVRFDVRTFNEKLNLYKDASNIYVLESSFNTVTDNFPNDNITITATEFVSGMTEDQVISVGAYSTMYSDFIQLVNTYFGYAGGFSSLFSSASEFDINGGVFDASSVIKIINEYDLSGGENVKQVTGSITISNINNLLKYAIDSNVFKNRTTQQSTGSASDTIYDVSGYAYDNSLNKSNYGMADGFIAGDLIFIPAGTTIGLHLVIDTENYTPLNNLGPSNVTNLINTMDTSRTSTTKYYPDNNDSTLPTDILIDGTTKIFTERSTATTTNIDKVLTAPLLIKLDNLSE